MASKVQVVAVPASGSDSKAKAGPPPSKSDFPATPAQSAAKVQEEKLGDTPKPGQQEAAKLGGKPGELREIDGKPVTFEDAAHIAAAETAAGKPTGPGSLAAKAQSAAAANARDGTKGGEQTSKAATANVRDGTQGGEQTSKPQTSKPSASAASKWDAPEAKRDASEAKWDAPDAKRDAPEALSDKPGERQGDKKRDVAEPKVHYYKEKQSQDEGKDGDASSSSAVRQPKEVEVKRKDEIENANSIQSWLVPGAVAVLVIGVAIVVVSALSKSRQHSSR